MGADVFFCGCCVWICCGVGLLRVELCGEAGESFGWWCEAMAGAGGRGFELCGGEDTQRTGVAVGEVLVDSLLLLLREFAVDEGAERIGIKMFG